MTGFWCPAVSRPAVYGYRDHPTPLKLCDHAQALDAKLQGDDGEDCPEVNRARLPTPSLSEGLAPGTIAAIVGRGRDWLR